MCTHWTNGQKLEDMFVLSKETVGVWSTHISAILSWLSWGSCWPWSSSGARPLQHNIMNQSQGFHPELYFCIHCLFSSTSAAYMYRMWFEQHQRFDNQYN